MLESIGPIDLGQKVIIRANFTYTGRLIEVWPTFFVLKDAAWIPSSGRWGHALATGELDEVEPFPDGPVIVARPTYDVARWNHPLPREAK